MRDVPEGAHIAFPCNGWKRRPSISVTPLYRDGFLLVLVRDIALPCTGNNALLRPSAAAPHRSEPARSAGGGREGREAGSSVEKGTKANDRGNRLDERDRAGENARWKEKE